MSWGYPETYGITADDHCAHCGSSSWTRVTSGYGDFCGACCRWLTYHGPPQEWGQGMTTRHALISADGLYRYTLARNWAEADLYDTPRQRRALFVMLNPSTADAEHDDPTIRRCIGFAKRESCTELGVVNLFAYRATEPRELWRAHGEGVDIVGAENDERVSEAAASADLVVCAWGKVGRDGLARVWQTVELLRAARSAELLCLGLTKHGHPRHPLYVPGAAPLSRFIWPPVSSTRATLSS